MPTFAATTVPSDELSLKSVVANVGLALNTSDIDTDPPDTISLYTFSNPAIPLDAIV